MSVGGTVIYTKDPVICDLTNKQINEAIEIADELGNSIGVFAYNRMTEGMNIAFLDNEFVFIRRIVSYALPLKKSIKKERSKMTPKFRYEILKRDKYKCKICGRDSKETILHVDHIIPISKGGKTEKNNLQTLCAECNIGKFID